jgi:hypothetical protein
MMKLYGFPPSPNTWKVRAVAAQLGLPLQLEFVDLTKPRTPEYLVLNPTGRTPTLVDGEFKLWESNAIMHTSRAAPGTRSGPATQVCAQTSCVGRAGSSHTGVRRAASR